MLTRGELDALTFGTAVAMVTFVVLAAWESWRQEREIRQQGAALAQQATAIEALWADLAEQVEYLDRVWDWCHAAAEALGWGDGGPGPDDGDDPDDVPPPPDGPATVISHPADMWARKAALLERYQHIGAHRT